MNNSKSMPPWIPVVGSAETELRGFDWQSLWSHNSHALYDQRLFEGGKTTALLTLPPSELLLLLLLYLFLYPCLTLFLNSIHLWFPLFFSPSPLNYLCCGLSVTETETFEIGPQVQQTTKQQSRHKSPLLALINSSTVLHIVSKGREHSAQHS